MQRLEMVAEWFNEVCRRTGALVAQWQCAGFCHGVLNTDVRQGAKHAECVLQALG